VGDGSSINIWNTNWLPRDFILEPLCLIFGDPPPDGLKVYLFSDKDLEGGDTIYVIPSDGCGSHQTNSNQSPNAGRFPSLKL
jgi:hypothetical protein